MCASLQCALLVVTTSCLWVMCASSIFDAPTINDNCHAMEKGSIGGENVDYFSFLGSEINPEDVNTANSSGFWKRFVSQLVETRPASLQRDLSMNPQERYPCLGPKTGTAKSLFRASTSSNALRRNRRTPSAASSSLFTTSNARHQRGAPQLEVNAVSRVAKASRTKMWPPWPFSLLSGSSSAESEMRIYSYSGNSNQDYSHQQVPTQYDQHQQQRSGLLLLWSFARQNLRVSINRIRYVSSQLWFHLPPAAAPLILLSLVPQQQRIIVQATTKALKKSSQPATLYKTIIPLISDRFARFTALGFVGLAIMSWAHSELNFQRKLTPLPLSAPYRDLHRAILPPFLPPEVHLPLEPHEDFSNKKDGLSDDHDHYDENEDEENDTTSDEAAYYYPRLRKHWNYLAGKAPRPRSFKALRQEWRRRRQANRLKRENAKRVSSFSELQALQAMKRKEARRIRQQQQRDGNDDEEEDIGFALVTGASRGIGRALAVQLARFEIPLILVARDLDRLVQLAFDIEACYGVKCCVLQADLGEPGAAEAIFQTTQAARLPVDILINNAGFTLHGESVDLPLAKLNTMIQLNAVSTSTLAHLYGKEMKHRRRGRIMMVSSICGAVAGLPSVAVYAATKAFENTLSLSLGLELEPYGVGVTCVSPGAVRDTEFKSSSNTEQALCWNLPGYARTAREVAEMGVRAMLRGDRESMPGWQNRAFIKVLKPVMPQRLHNLVAEVFWKPFRLPFSRNKQSRQTPTRTIRHNSPNRRTQQAILLQPLHTGPSEEPELPETVSPVGPLSSIQQLHPQLLKLEEMEHSGNVTLSPRGEELAPQEPTQMEPLVRRNASDDSTSSPSLSRSVEVSSNATVQKPPGDVTDSPLADADSTVAHRAKEASQFPKTDPKQGSLPERTEPDGKESRQDHVTQSKPVPVASAIAPKENRTGSSELSEEEWITSPHPRST